ncbi:hypothetical protein INS49_014807 [Diaporthe citri]|uniref:uncharacterized protein n=1 Tax=Diaporthe citri TaxID=83186 RepID=UPI001C7FC749|nr:uncharacterized protein INS49_014807 [Diaporthe citri]KAG6356932.1 hypothetical protein INS49_014807 [Diaporthe citri]
MKSDIVCNYGHPNHEKNRTRRSYFPATATATTTSSLQTPSLSSLPSPGPPASITPDSEFCKPFYDDLDLNLDAISNESSLLDHIHAFSNGTSGSEDDCSFFPIDVLGQVELSSPFGPCSIQGSIRTGTPDSAQHDGPAVTFAQTRTWGGSHWETAFDQFDKITFLSNQASDRLADSDLQYLYGECKHLAEGIRNKSLSSAAGAMPDSDSRCMLPSRDLSNKLVEMYFETFGPVFPTLHRPSFQDEYDNYWLELSGQDAQRSSAMSTIVCLVLAIGSSVYSGGLPASLQSQLHSRARKWMLTARSWFKTEFPREALGIPKLQTLCLFLLARQLFPCGLDDEESSLSADYALRLANRMGLQQRKPASGCQSDVAQVQLRHSLWCTVTELSIQSSLDLGEHPLLLPEHLADNHLLHTAVTASEQIQAQSQSPIQTALMRSLPVRLKIAKLLNSPDVNSISYEEVIRLDRQLVESSRSDSHHLRVFPESDIGSSNMAIPWRLCNILTRRFRLALHHPFASKAGANPTYFFSRHVCRETSLLLLRLLSPVSHDTALPDYDHGCFFVGTAGGVFKSVLIHATTSVCLEVFHELADDPLALSTAPTVESKQAMLKDWWRAIERSIVLCQHRINAGETDIRAYVLFRSVLGQITAIKAGQNENESIFRAARESLRYCYHLLQSRTTEEPLIDSDKTPFQLM